MVWNRLRSGSRNQARLRSHGRFPRRIGEPLENRVLLAGDLVAHWVADSLNAQHADGAVVAAWEDSVGGLTAVAAGTPMLQQGLRNGRSTVRFDGADGADSFRVAANSHPMNGANDFTVAVVFATLSPGENGVTGNWFDHTGLVDASRFGFTTDWGLAFNEAGQVSAGMGVGFGTPVTSVYSAETGLHDGQLHLATFARSGDTMSLYIDDGPAQRVFDANDGVRGMVDITFGVLQPNQNPLTGEMAEVRIYDGALDGAAVAALYSEFRGYYHNQAPVAVDDGYSLSEDPLFGFHVVNATEGLLRNDLDSERDQLSAVLVGDATHGSVVVRQDGSFVYSPEPNFFGTDSFTYQARDGQGSNVATVTLQVANTYDAPIPVADDYRVLPTQTLVVEAEDGLLANDQNPDGVSLTVELLDGVSVGELRLQNDGSFTFDPQGFAGEASFTYRVGDGTQWSELVPVTITVNTPPQARADAYDVMEDVPLVVPPRDGVLANDVDADGNLLTAVLTAEPLHGIVQFQDDGSFHYSPPAEFSGEDEFRYLISDGMTQSVDVTVSLHILPVNDPPEVADDYYWTLPSKRLEIAAADGVLANDSDKETAQLRAIVVDPPSHGTLQLDPEGGFSYVPAAGFVGTDSFRYRADDMQDLSEPVTVHLRVDAQPVQISEFMAANVDTLLTRTRESAEDSFRRDTEEAYDWVELWNPTDAPLAIGGLYLTDDLQEITKWQIPAGTTIAPNDYWVVFASGEDLTNPALDELGYLHTNFKLGSDGEYLAVGAPGNVVLFEFGVEYPQQRPGVSYGLDSSGQQRYFLAPTPGAENGVGLAGAVADTQFSVDRGFYDQPQQVVISTATPEAAVYYTTDGSEPDPQNPSAHLYEEPLVVRSTTTLRAAAFREGLLPSNVDTQTYIFAADVPSQGNRPEGYPERWRASSGTLPGDYEMDPEITQNPAYQDVMDEALLSIPTISIVTSVGNLFDPDRGIYMYPQNDGAAWERPTSVELIFPDGTKGFQVDAGLRIQGGASRLPEKSPKHSFRLLFRDRYGASKLEYPLFGTEAVDEFDTLILRAGFNQSFIHHNTFLGDNRGRAQYVRDQWAKDTQAAMGHPAAHNNYAHLYINGMYWGLYNPTERPANGFAESYLGGDKEDYDVLNSGDVIDGDNQAWSDLLRRSRATWRSRRITRPLLNCSISMRSSITC